MQEDIAWQASLLLHGNHGAASMKVGQILPAYELSADPDGKTAWSPRKHDFAYLVTVLDAGTMSGSFFMHREGGVWTGEFKPGYHALDLDALNRARAAIAAETGTVSSFRLLSAYEGCSWWLAGSNGEREVAVCVWSGDYCGPAPDGVPRVGTILDSDELSRRSARWRKPAKQGIGRSTERNTARPGA